MENRIRLLGIVPYEGMKALLANLAEEYPQVEIDVFVGNMDEGVEIAKSNFYSNYDAVISRGGTATALRQLNLPVIDIEISLYDILYALKLSNGLQGKLAMVAYANITVSAQILCDLLNYQIEIYTVKTLDELEPTLRRLQEAQYGTILCDTTANMIARSLGLNTIFIASGIESIRHAINRALALCRSQARLQSENKFFRELLHGQADHVAVFDQNGQLVFTSAGSLSPELYDLLRRELEQSPAEGERRVTRSTNGVLYFLRIRPFISGVSYTAIYYAARKSPFSRSQSGVRFFSRQEAEKQAYSGILNFHELYDASEDEIRLLAESMVPIVVAGEDGTCIERIVDHLYLHSPLQNAPLVSINCSLLNEKSWEFLLEHHNSPLAETGTTLYFSNIDVLSTKSRRQLLETLAEAEVCRRNHVFLACTCQPGEHLSPVGAEFLNRLNGRALYLQPLRNLKDTIPAQIKSALSLLNTSIPYPVLGAEPEAIQLLQAFNWPHNYTQLQRVIETLATSSQQIITAENVRQVLRKEQYGEVSASYTGGTFAPLDLNQTLDQINQEIAQRVLAETGGNQTAAARRLGISRTTLRRLVTVS